MDDNPAPVIAGIIVIIVTIGIVMSLQDHRVDVEDRVGLPQLDKGSEIRMLSAPTE
ncbi:MAG: hypothetical protein AAF198_11730 [Pseudomonadota bacterium]